MTDEKAAGVRSPGMSRCWRDVHAVASHLVMTWDVAAENFGRCKLGLGRNEAYPMF